MEGQENKVSQEMPKYKCHKEVHALKIKEVVTDESRDGVTLVFEEEEYSGIEVDGAYNAKHKPEAGGYYVVYADDYVSFSPAEAFESGYTKIEDGFAKAPEGAVDPDAQATPDGESDGEPQPAE